MNSCAFGLLFLILIISLVAFIFMQYFYHLKSNAQTELSLVQNQPLGKSGFLEHVYHYDKHLNQTISHYNAIGFVFALIPPLLVTVGFVYLIIDSELPSLERCTILICLTIFTCVIILTTILYQLHSERMAIERDLGYKTYYLERKKAERPSKDENMAKSESKPFDSDKYCVYSDNKL